MARNNTRRTLRLFLMLTCVGIAVSGCADKVTFSDGVASSPYHEIFERELSGPLSEFQKEILADGVVTDSEVTEAQGRFKSCFEDLGYSVGIDPNDGSYTWSGKVGDDQAVVEAAYDECKEKFVSAVGPMYYDMKKNPKNEVFEDLIVECLKRNGYIDPGFATKMTGETIITLLTDENSACFQNPMES
ncbi:hypothetical protein SAMN05216410_0919 [Sanguibacter gelidistatuariae]|uniref:DUF732 domain-containing protein n=2 Tax=Sanguibacter gelidistatuariae TaxID=1814289 RepID=A0A1G6HCH7_9MICO|nr:hypothetical protein SAMN05216410_0919 [Sanguibacter gelidistatuariae]